MGNLLLILVFATGAAAGGGDCRAQSGFDRGYAGVAPVASCTAQDYRGAWRLGSDLAALEAERRQLLAHDDGGGGASERDADAGRRARRVRQLSVDIEAIGAALQLRGIIQEGPRPPQPANGAPAQADPA